MAMSGHWVNTYFSLLKDNAEINVHDFTCRFVNQNITSMSITNT